MRYQQEVIATGLVVAWTYSCIARPGVVERLQVSQWVASLQNSHLFCEWIENDLKEKGKGQQCFRQCEQAYALSKTTAFCASASLLIGSDSRLWRQGSSDQRLGLGTMQKDSPLPQLFTLLHSFLMPAAAYIF